jgi:hypothetical protein
VIWLKNRTSTVAVVSKTPFEAVTGKKPNLAKLPEWGCVAWVHTKKNLKLDGRATEGHWVGFDEQSKGHRIFWPGKRSVTVEHSVVFTEPLVSVGELEGEDSVGHSTVKPASTATEADSRQDDEPSTPPQMPSIPVPETPHIQRICKPSRYVRDLQSIGSATGFANCSAIPEGLQVPVEKSQWTDEDIEEVTLVVDVGDVKPLEPKSLTDAKRRPDWPNWERRIHEELKTLA